MPFSPEPALLTPHTSSDPTPTSPPPRRRVARCMRWLSRRLSEVRRWLTQVESPPLSGCGGGGGAPATVVNDADKQRGEELPDQGATEAVAQSDSEPARGDVAEEDEEEYEQEEEEQEEEAGGDELDGADGEGGQDDEEERDVGEGGVVKSLVSLGYDRAVAASAVATVAMAPRSVNTQSSRFAYFLFIYWLRY